MASFALSCACQGYKPLGRAKGQGPKGSLSMAHRPRDHSQKIGQLFLEGLMIDGRTALEHPPSHTIQTRGEKSRITAKAALNIVGSSSGWRRGCTILPPAALVRIQPGEVW